MSSKNGALYKVCFTESQRRLLRTWSDDALKLSLKDQLLQDLKRMMAKLSQDPCSGEKAYPLPNMRLMVRRLALDLLTVYFAVDENRHIVFVKDIMIASGFGFSGQP